MISSDLLKAVYFFQNFNAEEVNLVKNICERKPFGSYQTIFREGDKAEMIYLVEFGSVKIIKNDEDIITIGQGGTFGEVPFLDGNCRSGTAITIEDSHLIEIAYERLTELLVDNPSIALKFYTTAAQFVSKRLRTVMEDLGHVKSIFHSHHAHH
jgi:CRP-like cAMP-binding protein